MLLVLDSASLYYRAFHSLPESMTAPDGTPHNALRGFLATVARLVRQHGATSLAPAWDADWRPQWRVDLIPSYKTHRVAEDEGASTDGAGADIDGMTEASSGREVGMPESLGPQVDAIAELLQASHCPVLGVDGFEADDVVATIAAQRPCIVVSGDRDLVQVVDERVRMHLTVNGGMDKWPVLDPAGVVERFGVAPQQYVDLSVLRGDPSDGLPGVPGIGAKTAVSLLSAHGDLDSLLAAARCDPARPLTPRLAALLLGSEDYLARARVVATARRDVPVDTQGARPKDSASARAVAREWGVERVWDELLTAFVGSGG